MTGRQRFADEQRGRPASGELPLSPRSLCLIAGFFAGIVFILFLSFALDVDGKAAAVLLDRAGLAFPYPFTVQNIMWLFFFTGCGEIVHRFMEISRQSLSLSLKLLPEEDDRILQRDDLGSIYERVQKTAGGQRLILQTLIQRTILQFQSSKSTDQANNLLNSSGELFQHEIDLGYTFLRYMVWILPTLGFIGTVIGIALALDVAGNPPDVTNAGALKPWMQELTQNLAVAFNTTLVALIQSAILVCAMQASQAKEEMILNKSIQYCLDNLINRLYER